MMPSNENTGLPCPSCRVNMERIAIERVGDDVFVRINTKATQKELRGLIKIIKSFCESDSSK